MYTQTVQWRKGKSRLDEFWTSDFLLPNPLAEYSCDTWELQIKVSYTKSNKIQREWRTSRARLRWIKIYSGCKNKSEFNCRLTIVIRGWNKCQPNESNVLYHIETTDTGTKRHIPTMNNRFQISVVHDSYSESWNGMKSHAHPPNKLR